MSGERTRLPYVTLAIEITCKNKDAISFKRSLHVGRVSGAFIHCPCLERVLTVEMVEFSSKEQCGGFTLL